MKSGALAARDDDYADLFRQDASQPHWAYDYADRLARRHPPERRILIQTSMSPSGPFHVGNFRDTAIAHLVHRALRRMGRRSAILLSFDDFDPIRAGQAARQPELAGYAARPLGAVPARSTAICRRYIAELKRAGICPSEADLDGRTPPGSHWQTHYQHERYLAGTYARLQGRYQRHAGKLARLLGAKAPESLFSVYCEQCGRGTTAILDLGPARVRYACRSCGAIAVTGNIGVVKPSWALDWTLRVTHERIDCEPAGQDHCSAGSTMDRTRVIYRRFLGSRQPVIVPYGLVRQFGDRGKVSGSRGGGITLGDLLPIMPPAMILWLYGRTNCKADFRISTERAGFLASYAAYDAFLDAVRAGDRRARVLHELTTDAEVPAPAPRMRTVLGLLHGLCYDADLVAAALGGTPEAHERARYARAWLAAHGRRWIDAERDVVPDAAGLIAGGDLPERWSRDSYRTLSLTLFGTDDGPPLRRLEQVFGREAIVAAIRAYADRGERPLRERVLARSRSGDPGAR
ncbi:hypothetical protein GCM10022252_59850 [Streptosporangium oxazolinicum]|uniref:Lysine--tRNA ligase n=1 Tax=Streptosporangium oxazolinicum TaxID=909287 RepID=A0ABP8BBW1_9ACTN